MKAPSKISCLYPSSTALILAGLLISAYATFPLVAEAAIAATVLETQVDIHSPDTSITTGSFTPANNSLLVVFVASLNPGGSGSPSIAGGGLTWTQQASSFGSNSWDSHVLIYTAPVTTGSSMTVTHDADANITDSTAGQAVVVVQITGHNAADPVAQVFNDSGNSSRSGSFSGSLAGAPSTGSYVFAVSTSDNDAGSLNLQTTGTGWTQTHEEVFGDFSAIHVQQRTGSTSSSVYLNNFTAGYSWAIAAIEIEVAAAPTVTTTAATNVASTSATLNGNITDVGSVNPTVRGFAWGTSSGLTTGVSTTSESGSFSTGAFTGGLTNLTPETTYYFRAYATNANGTSYGSIESLTTDPVASLTTIFLTSTTTTTWTVPDNWNNSSNTIEVIGGGGGGDKGTQFGYGGSGGGGGGYSKVTNATLTAGGSIGYAVGAAGVGSTTGNGSDGGDTFFCSSTSNCASLSDSAVVVGAEGGEGATTTSPSGGKAANGIGTVKYSGGNGGNGYLMYSGGGGGGAAGPHGAGAVGGDAGGNSGNGAGGGGGANNGSAGGSGASNGGAGGNNRSSTGGGSAGASSNGGAGSSGGGGGGGDGDATRSGGSGSEDTVWTQTSDSASAGPGGGGGGSGGSAGTSAAGAAGGGYGAGGGGSGIGGSGVGAGGNGTQGIIVITYYPLPETPGAPTFSNVTATSTTQSWTMANGAETYTVTRCTNSSTCSVFTGIASLARSDTGTLAGNTSYTYAVQGVNDGGSGAWSATSTQLTLPGIPGTPTFSNVGTDSLTVNWTAPTGGASTYKIERCEGVGCTSFAENATGQAGLTYNDTNLADDTTYRYRVRATNATGDGLYSGIGSQATEAGVPGAPGTPSFSNVTATSTTQSWSAAADATSYNVTRCTDSSTCSVITGIVGTSRSDTGTLTGNTSYDYAVQGVNANGGGAWSATSTVLTLPGIPGTPSFSNTTQTTVRVSWAAPTGGAATYIVQRCTGGGCTNFTTIATGLTDALLNDAFLTLNTTYRYRIRGSNATGSGLDSAIADVTTSNEINPEGRVIRLRGLRLNGARLR